MKRTIPFAVIVVAAFGVGSVTVVWVAWKFAEWLLP